MRISDWSSDVCSSDLGAEVVEQAAETMLKRIAEAMPQARLQGFTVQAMCRRPQAEELILGRVTDAPFGPVMLFGQGGPGVEVIADTTHAFTPLAPVSAYAVMEATTAQCTLTGRLTGRQA